MSWFYLSLIHAVFAALTWLMLKRAQNKRASNEGSLFVYFVFLLVGIFAWHLMTQTPFILPNFKWGLILSLAGIFAAFSNLLVMSSFGRSPNPGFSLALSSTQSIWVALSSVIIFRSDFHPTAMLGVLIILIGVFIIHIKKSSIDFKWGELALFSAFITTFYWIFVTAASRALPSLQVTVILTLVVLPQLFVFAVLRFKNMRVREWSNVSILSFLALAGIMGAVSNLSSIAAAVTAPNPGYALAIGASNIILATFLSFFFFKSSLNRRQVFATFVIVLGIVLIRLGA